MLFLKLKKWIRKILITFVHGIHHLQSINFDDYYLYFSQIKVLEVEHLLLSTLAVTRTERIYGLCLIMYVMEKALV